jgi:hypothetical protein
MPINAQKINLGLKVLENILKKQHRCERARRLVKFFKNRNKGTRLAYMVTTG